MGYISSWIMQKLLQQFICVFTTALPSVWPHRKLYNKHTARLDFVRREQNGRINACKQGCLIKAPTTTSFCQIQNKQIIPVFFFFFFLVLTSVVLLRTRKSVNSRGRLEEKIMDNLTQWHDRTSPAGLREENHRYRDSGILENWDRPNLVAWHQMSLSADDPS